MLEGIKLRDFRCFVTLETDFSEGGNLILGANAQGKTSLLEAICVLLRLQSPRVSTLAQAIRHDCRGFVLDGFFDRRHLQFYFSARRKKLALDSVEQTSAHEYLEVARVVWFSNQDLEIVRGPAERRRRFLDFVAAQHVVGYRRSLRDYGKALRSRNFLLKSPNPRWRQIKAFDEPLVRSANALFSARRRVLEALAPTAEFSQRSVGGGKEALMLDYRPGVCGDYAVELEATRDEDLRLRQTTVGPHRDDFGIALDGQDSAYASEGQQRTVALALKLAEARLIREQLSARPVLLIDDIFGELDPDRRNALLSHLPRDCQRFVTATNLDWATDTAGWDRRLRLRGGMLEC